MDTGAPGDNMTKTGESVSEPHAEDCWCDECIGCSCCGTLNCAWYEDIEPDEEPAASPTPTPTG